MTRGAELLAVEMKLVHYAFPHGLRLVANAELREMRGVCEFPDHHVLPRLI